MFAASLEGLGAFRSKSSSLCENTEDKYADRSPQPHTSKRDRPPRVHKTTVPTDFTKTGKSYSGPFRNSLAIGDCRQDLPLPRPRLYGQVRLSSKLRSQSLISALHCPLSKLPVSRSSGFC